MLVKKIFHVSGTRRTAQFGTADLSRPKIFPLAPKILMHRHSEQFPSPPTVFRKPSRRSTSCFLLW